MESWMDLFRAFLPSVAEKGTERTLECLLHTAGSASHVLVTPNEAPVEPFTFAESSPPIAGVICSLSERAKDGNAWE